MTEANKKIEHTPHLWRWFNGHLVGDHGRRPVVLGAGGRGGFLVQRQPESGSLVTFDPESPDGQLLALAPTAPHDCEHEGCPGRETKEQIEAFRELAVLLAPYSQGPSELVVDVLKRRLEILKALQDAVRYTLGRVQTDPEFRWHMLGTETLDRLIRAEAAATGRTEGEVRQERETDRQPDHRRREPECALNRERVRGLELFIEDLGHPIPERRR